MPGVDAQKLKMTSKSNAGRVSDLSGTWFISDMHLCSERPAVSQALWQFLEDMSEHLHQQPGSIEQLYLLGDQFETWIGDDGHNEIADILCTHLKRLSQQGVTVNILHGNRDFLIGEHFVQQFDGVLLPETHITYVFGHRVLLLHGDELCIDDTEYQKIRQMFRSHDWQQAFLKQSVSNRQAQASAFRQASRAAQKGKSLDIMDVNTDRVHQAFTQYNVNTIIHGHTHRPNIHHYFPSTTSYHAERCRVVLGDWGSHAWALQANASGLFLLSWENSATVHQATPVKQHSWDLTITEAIPQKRTNPTLSPELIDFLGCPTPDTWLNAAQDHLNTLIIDHANCEKKAASTALSLMYRYTDKPDLLTKLSQLAREELLHFEQVITLMQQRNIPYLAVSASNYAQGLHQHARRDEPGRLIDALIIGAFIEARSCERFYALIPYMDEQLARYYTYLLKSESRHFTDYLTLAQGYHEDAARKKGRAVSSECEFDHFEDRVAFFRRCEAELISTPCPTFRFHSGPFVLNTTTVETII